jgi:hypothetical protein
MSASKVERLLSAAQSLRASLIEVEGMVCAYMSALEEDGTDSLAAVDWINSITNVEMVIQRFTNAVSDIEGEDEPSEEEGDDIAAAAAPLGWDSVEGGWQADEVANEYTAIAAAVELTTLQQAQARLSDQKATRDHMRARKGDVRPQAVEFAVVEDYASNLCESVRMSKDMARVGKLTRASHGPMIQEQIKAAIDAAAQLISLYDSMKEA